MTSKEELEHLKYKLKQQKESILPLETKIKELQEEIDDFIPTTYKVTVYLYSDKKYTTEDVYDFMSEGVGNGILCTYETEFRSYKIEVEEVEE